MDPKVIILALVTIYEVEMAPAALRSQPRHRRADVKTVKCDREWYFDPNLGENGRCQPCDEICNPSWGTEDQCLANIEQCNGTYLKHQLTTALTILQYTSTSGSDVEPKPQTIVIVAVATGLVALVTCALLAGYLYKNHRKSIKNFCLSCVHRPRNVKPVDESSLHLSRDRICVTSLNSPLTGSIASQALLSRYLQEEYISQSQNPEPVVCLTSILDS